MKEILVLSVGPVPCIKGLTVEGGGLRAWGIAQGLASHGIHSAVAVPDWCDKCPIGQYDSHIAVIKWSYAVLPALLKRYQTVYILYSMGELAHFVCHNIPTDSRLIVDLYVPIYIEALAGERMPADEDSYESYLRSVSLWNEIFKRGDHFICAHDSQYDFYLGVLSAMGRVNPINIRDFNLLSIVPFGISNVHPTKGENVIRGKKVKEDDFVLLWFGGLYPWFDILPLLHAAKTLSKVHKSLKLVIVGGRNPFVVEEEFQSQYFKALAFSQKHNLLHRSIFFVDWIPYEERGRWYAESDVVISLYGDGLENRYSWRTRVVDYVWGGLPMILSSGDSLGKTLEDRGAAVIVGKNSDDCIIEAIQTFLFNEKKLETFKKNIFSMREEFYWEHVVAPIVDFIKFGHVARDRFVAENLKRKQRHWSRLSSYILRKKRNIVQIYKSRGLSGIIKKLTYLFKKKFSVLRFF